MVFKALRNIIACCAVIGIFLGTEMRPAAAAAGDASAVVKELFNDGFGVLQNTSLGKRERAERLSVLLEKYFYIDAMREWMLGNYRGSLSSEEHARYQKLFSGYIVALFSPQLASVATEKKVALTVLKEELVRENDVVVTTEFAREGKDPVKIQWRTRRTQAGPKILDVGYEGIWLAVALREQIVSVIDGNGVSGFLKTLEERVASPLVRIGKVIN